MKRLTLILAVVALFLPSCAHHRAHRHPATWRELSGQGVEPLGGYQDYLP